MADMINSLVSAILGKQAPSPYPEDYMNNRQQMRMMGANPRTMPPKPPVDPNADVPTGDTWPGQVAGGGAGGASWDSGAVAADAASARAELEAAMEAAAGSGTGAISGDSTYDPGTDQFMPVQVMDVDRGSKRHGPGAAMANDGPDMEPDNDMDDAAPPGKSMAQRLGSDSIAPSPKDKVQVETEAPAGGGGGGGGGGGTRTVKRGDNLWKIAQGIAGEGASKAQVNALVKRIAQMNGLKDANKISVGQSLKVPGTAVGDATPRPRGKGQDSDEAYG